MPSQDSPSTDQYVHQLEDHLESALFEKSVARSDPEGAIMLVEWALACGDEIRADALTGRLGLRLRTNLRLTGSQPRQTSAAHGEGCRGRRRRRRSYWGPENDIQAQRERAELRPDGRLRLPPEESREIGSRATTHLRVGQLDRD